MLLTVSIFVNKKISKKHFSKGDAIFYSHNKVSKNDIYIGVNFIDENILIVNIQSPWYPSAEVRFYKKVGSFFMGLLQHL